MHRLLLVLSTVLFILTLSSCGTKLNNTGGIGTGSLPPLSGELSPNTLHSHMLEAINSTRSSPTLCNNRQLEAANPLTWQPLLAGAAKSIVRDFLSRVASDPTHYRIGDAPPHVDSTGGRVDSRVTAQGYDWLALGENLASDTSNSPRVDAIVSAWEQSTSSHCEEMVNPRYEHVGIYYEGGAWAVVFGDPR